MKQQAAEKIGMKMFLMKYNADISQKSLLDAGIYVFMRFF